MIKFRLKAQCWCGECCSVQNYQMLLNVTAIAVEWFYRIASRCVGMKNMDELREDTDTGTEDTDTDMEDTDCVV